MEQGRRAFKILTSKPTGKRSSGKTSSRWENNIRMNLNKYVSLQGDELRMEIVGELS